MKKIQKTGAKDGTFFAYFLKEEVIKMGVLEKIDRLIPGPMIQRNRRILVALFAILSAALILSS